MLCNEESTIRRLGVRTARRHDNATSRGDATHRPSDNLTTRRGDDVENWQRGGMRLQGCVGASTRGRD
eukprot:11210453-Lingulodinium_polyedra.AAC.1